MLRSCQQAALQAGAVFHMPDGTERLTGSPGSVRCLHDAQGTHCPASAGGNSVGVKHVDSWNILTDTAKKARGEERVNPRDSSLECYCFATRSASRPVILRGENILYTARLAETRVSAHA